MYRNVLVCLVYFGFYWHLNRKQIWDIHSPLVSTLWCHLQVDKKRVTRAKTASWTFNRLNWLKYGFETEARWTFKFCSQRIVLQYFEAESVSGQQNQFNKAFAAINVFYWLPPLVFMQSNAFHYIPSGLCMFKQVWLRQICCVVTRTYRLKGFFLFVDGFVPCMFHANKYPVA